MTPWTIVSFHENRPSDWAMNALSIYLKKMKYWVEIDHILLKPYGGKCAITAQKHDRDRIVSHKSFQKRTVVLCDSHGPDVRSSDLAQSAELWAHSRHGVCFVIGPTYGLCLDWVRSGLSILKLSSLTLPHELAMVLAAEQLYRSLTICHGIPYHHSS